MKIVRLFYLPMERMDIEELKDYYKARVEPYGKPMNEILEEFAKETKAYKELEEENKKLKEEIKSRQEEVERFKDNAMQDMAEITELEIQIKKLKEENQTLELWLDNKEKLNEEYRDKIDLLKYQSYGPSELSDSLYDANKTIEKLRAELSKYKKQYEHSMGEDDELIYEEGLYD